MESIIKRLDINNEKHLYSQLYKIRSEYIKNEASIVRKTLTKSKKFLCLYFYFQISFAKFSGIKKLSDILAKCLEVTETTSQNERIIEVVLSIIGNCTCNVELCANQVRNNIFT